MNDLSVIILTYNEEIHIARAIDSVAGIADQIVVVDSFSTDRTVEIAKELGATVLRRKFDNQARQFQWALDTAAISGAWVMRLDADEVIEPDLAAEIKAGLPSLPPGVTGINLKRKHIFMGRWIRHGDRYPVTLLRIWRRGMASVEERWMDEHVVLSSGRAVTFEGGFADHNLHDLSHFIDKHNRYATREAVEVLNQRHGLFAAAPGVETDTWSQAGLKRNVKLRFYNRLPFALAALSYFLYRYVIRGGFLDGREGLIYHGLQGGWYRFLVGAKVIELERAIAGCNDRGEALKRLAAATGLTLERQA
ncbi:MAG: glycosyltransferase family 2 protein [Pseudomonadota bacterium]